MDEINKIVFEFEGLDKKDAPEVDWFIHSIRKTDEYRAEVINELDYDLDEFLNALATDDDCLKSELSIIKDRTRELAIDLFERVEEENNEPTESRESGMFGNIDFLGSSYFR